VGGKTVMVAWDRVTRRDVLRAIRGYDRMGPEQLLSEHGFAPATTYELVWEKGRYPPKAVLGAAYEFATGQQLGSGDFEKREDRGRKSARPTRIQHRKKAKTVKGDLEMKKWKLVIPIAAVVAFLAWYASPKPKISSPNHEFWCQIGVKLEGYKNPSSLGLPQQLSVEKKNVL
jgi:hypothetical protein